MTPCNYPDVSSLPGNQSPGNTFYQETIQPIFPPLLRFTKKAISRKKQKERGFSERVQQREGEDGKPYRGQVGGGPWHWKDQLAFHLPLVRVTGENRVRGPPRHFLLISEGSGRGY